MFHYKIEIQTRAEMNAELSAREELSSCSSTLDLFSHDLHYVLREGKLPSSFKLNKMRSSEHKTVLPFNVN